MKESKANQKCAARLVKIFGPRCKYYKHADRFTRGIPDSTFTWNRRTTWLEFKMLAGGEDLHQQLDKIQLVELIQLQSAGLAWVVAFRKATRLLRERTDIYSPIALLQGGKTVTPSLPLGELSTHETVLRDLQVHGVASFDGFDYDAVAALIRATH